MRAWMLPASATPSYVLDQALDLPLRRLFGARDAAEYA